MANLRSGRTNAYFCKVLCTGTRGRPEKSRRWSLENAPWIGSLKNASVAYIFRGMNCHRLLIKFWSRWLECKSRRLGNRVPFSPSSISWKSRRLNTQSSRFFSRLKNRLLWVLSLRLFQEIEDGEKGTRLPSRLLLHSSHLLQNLMRSLWQFMPRNM